MRRTGLTLIEVVLAITLTVGLMMSALSFYKYVADVREDFDGQLRSVRLTAARRAVMDRITDELRGAMVYVFLDFGLAGGPDSIQFMTAAVPGQSVWAVENITDDPTPPEHDIQLVGYRLRIVEDENGDEVVMGLERTYQGIVAAETAEEGEDIQASLLAPQFKFLAFRYWDSEAGDWVDSWQSGTLPLAVEIVLGVQELPEDLEPMDYPYATHRRVVFVPGGAQGSGQTTIIRGLGGGRG
jgi:hypothetical protein